jgi:hypothetical protein
MKEVVADRKAVLFFFPLFCATEFQKKVDKTLVFPLVMA